MESEQLELPNIPMPVSRYTFEDVQQGFVLHRAGGMAFLCQYDDTFKGVLVTLTMPDAQPTYARAALYGDSLIDAIGELVVTGLGYFTESSRRPNKSKRNEAKALIKHALTKRLSVAMQRLRKDIAPPEVSELAKKMWSSVFNDARIIHLPELYTDEYQYLRADLLKYHAARLYAKFSESYNSANLSIPDIAANWRSNLSVSGNKAMNHTLDRLPRGVSYHNIGNLRLVHLDQPVTTRLHLLAVLAMAEHHNAPLHMATLVHADDAQIIAASSIHGEGVYILNKRSKIADVQMVLSHVFDYDQPYAGDLVGLARRSEQWHNSPRRFNDTRQRMNPLRAVDAECARPSVNLDELAAQGVTWLGTANAVIREGWHMDHCIASYAGKAVDGRCFLFHVDYAIRSNDFQTSQVEEASIEVYPDGHIAQAYGPHDGKNRACEYGTVVLRKAFDAVGLRGRSAQGSTGFTLMNQVGFLATGERIVQTGDGTFHLWVGGQIRDMDERDQATIRSVVELDRARNIRYGPEMPTTIRLETRVNGTQFIAEQPRMAAHMGPPVRWADITAPMDLPRVTWRQELYGEWPAEPPPVPDLHLPALHEGQGMREVWIDEANTALDRINQRIDEALTNGEPVPVPPRPELGENAVTWAHDFYHTRPFAPIPDEDLRAYWRRMHPQD